MTDPILSQHPSSEQAFVPDRDDPEVWALRRDNDAWLRSRRWCKGISQQRRVANLLAAEGEAKAAELIRARGLQVHPTTKQCAFDLWAADDAGRACRVEVKTSLYTLCHDPRKGGRYEANIRSRQNNNTDLVIFLAKNGAWWPYVIPIAAVGQRHNIAIWSPCPGDYKGQWAAYLNAWQHLEELIQRSRPRSWQLSLPLAGGGSGRGL